MLTRPMDVLTAFPVRKSKQQKQEFRDAVQSYLAQFGYSASVEKGSLGCRNMVIGDPETAQYLITAHYDTCARLPIPNLITPCNFWAFLGYQLVVMLLCFSFRRFRVRWQGCLREASTLVITCGFSACGR